jgi:hypothetical protein
MNYPAASRGVSRAGAPGARAASREVWDLKRINGSSAHQTIVNESRDSFSAFCACLNLRGSAGILSSAAGLTIVNQLNLNSGGSIASIPLIEFYDNSAAGTAIFDNHSSTTADFFLDKPHGSL